MRFRTEIELQPDKARQITHDDGIFMLGSCFTDNIGALLLRDGFDVIYNPFGPLYNPISIGTALGYILQEKRFGINDFVTDDHGIWHCLDFPSRYSSANPQHLADSLNAQITELRAKLLAANTAIMTLGTAFIYYLIDTQKPVGNCHKFPQSRFMRKMLTVEECTKSIADIISLFDSRNINLIFTVSPIRHIGDTLHGNSLSKSTLLVALDNAMKASQSAFYFPAYEIMMDDLRDYRFYGADMVHPSETAIEYIYDKFSDVFFSPRTRNQAVEQRKLWKQMSHRPLPKI